MNKVMQQMMDEMGESAVKAKRASQKRRSSSSAQEEMRKDACVEISGSVLEDVACKNCGALDTCACDDATFGHSMNFESIDEVSELLEGAFKENDDEKAESAVANQISLPSAYQTFIHQSKYARYIDSLGRRETWSETIERYLSFFEQHLLEKRKFALDKETRDQVFGAIGRLEVMPSMRSLMTAGPALARDNMAGYNCSYTSVDDPRVFDEILYILMNGTGVGFSVERQYINNLPKIPEFRTFPGSEKHVIHVSDSKEGWAFALRQLVEYLYHGIVPTWDLSQLRPAGTRLKTFGGRSSGPDPLRALFVFVVETFKKAQGRKLSSIEAHDLVCKIAEIVVVGGVRRCLPATSMVFAKTGLIPIKDINVGDEVLTSKGYKKVLNKFDQGVQKLARITTQDGFIDCTANHRMAVFDSPTTYAWISTDELVPGDRLATTRVAIEGVKTSMPEWKQEIKLSKTGGKRTRQPEPITIPDLDPEMAWFIGAYHGDGSCSEMGKSVSLAFGLHEGEIAKRAQACLQRFNSTMKVVVEYPERAKFINVRCTSTALVRYIIKHIKKSKTPIVIPDWILRGTLDIRLAYMAGLMDSDGCVESSHNQILSTIYSDFARQVQLLAYSCGIETRLFTDTKPTSRSTNVMNHVSIINMRSKAIFGAIPQLTKKIQEKSKPMCSNGFPPHFFSDNKIRAKYALRTNKQLSLDRYDTEYGVNNICPVEVLRVTPDVREMNTYDIEVEDMHEFFVDGYLSHNSALISFSNLSDDRMRTAKSGEWWVDNPQRALANNSVCYTEKPDIGRFMKEWLSLYESKSGERGIFNQEACQNQVRKNCPNRDPAGPWHANPCVEIILPNRGLCNLSEVVVRADDTPTSLREKVRLATILGTWQATLIDFNYVSAKWRENCEKEFLLGVSLTGIMDNAFMAGRVNSTGLKLINKCEIEESADSPWAGLTLPKFLEELRDLAIETNKIWARKLDIKASAAITTVKPSGTVSQLVDSSSGIHTRHSRFYIRTVCSDVKDPLTEFLKDAGVPWERCVMKPNDTVVFSFPIKSPDKCITRDDRNALDQLEICDIYGRYWCQHKVSVTINVREHEWMAVGSWIWDNFDTVSGISFLPHSDHVYQQAPYQEVTEAEYNAAAKKMPKSIDWGKMRNYEKSDMTNGHRELACTAGHCEL